MSLDAPWLENYATDRHNWHKTARDGNILFYRRLGIVEGIFDTDGIHAGGRGDVTLQLQVEVRTSLSPRALRERILLAWSVLRLKHVLLSARAVEASEILPQNSGYAADERVFVVETSSSPEQSLIEATQHMVFVEDHYPDATVDELFVHALNSARCIDASRALSRFYVLPMKVGEHGTYHLHFVLVAAHQITDGLTFPRWMSAFIDLLNQSAQRLTSYARELVNSPLTPRLPPAQESLYPTVRGSAARQRWFWALARILRHTRKTPPPAFQTPLRRKNALAQPKSLPPTFSKIIDYSETPPLNTLPAQANLGPRSTHRLSRICRQAKISVGSGCFALVAMVMMLLEEQRNPHIPDDERLPFVGSFPINPRPFLTGEPTTGKEDSFMLAFSDGVTLPFLPSHLDFEGRLRLLGKQAARQLRQYQKRPRSLEEQVQLGSKNPSQFFPMFYLGMMEGLEARSVPDKKRHWNFQGQYSAKVGSTLPTCGVSSVGPRSAVISSGRYDVTKLPPGQDVVADFRSLMASVRARHNEFLVGVVGDNDHLRFQVSYDGCVIDPELAAEWKTVIENILEPEKAPISRL